MVRDYTTGEAAAKLDVTPDAILRAIQRGRLLAYKRSRIWLVDGNELDRWNKLRNKKGRALKK